ncbi:MAG: FkbM family methyltransferase [Rhodothermales bacterium]
MLIPLRRTLGHLRHRRAFNRLCQQNNLTLDYAANADSLAVLREVFYRRAYADYFPFYKDATVLDVGAHKGFFALFAAQHVGPASRIVCLEPAPATYQVLQQNLAANNVRIVTAVNAGLAAEAGTATLYGDQSWNASLLRPRPDVSVQPGVDVRVLTLADLLEDHALERVDFLKLDCEGAEYPVLFGTDVQTLARIRTVSLEFHDTGEARWTGLSLVRLLRERGFHVAQFHHAPSSRNRNYGRIIATRISP